MSVDLGRRFPPAIRTDAPLQERYDHLKEQVNILAAWILNNAGDRIDGGGACEVAVKLLREWTVMKEALTIFAVKGTKFDIHPTIEWRAGDEDSIHLAYLAYIRRMDDAVREDAERALTVAPVESLGREGEVNS